MSEWQLAPSTLAQWVGAIATTAAVVVALFKEEFMRRLRYLELTVRIQPFAPDCVKTPIAVGNAGNPRWSGDAYFLQFAKSGQIVISDGEIERAVLGRENRKRQESGRATRHVASWIPSCC
jgi:hypothetical protein